MRIVRNPELASEKTYDLVIIGGGVYGAMLTLQASQSGKSVLLLEKGDFGGATSFNSLRIVHGGLRYLQSLNFKRYHEFVGERRWFLQHFPDLVKPLPVLMPLYQQGMKRTELFRIAFLLDKALSVGKNRNLRPDNRLPESRLLSVAEVKRLFPRVQTRGLAGGALWYDGCVPDSQRLIIDVLANACRLGATVLNYVEAVELIQQNHRVKGIRARDSYGSTSFEFSAEVIVNATGPWNRELAARFDTDIPELFKYSIAWNYLLDRPALSSHALAVSPPQKGGQIYFLHPWKGRLLVGTGHAPRNARTSNPQPTEEETRRFITDLNHAIPGLDIQHREILHVFAGLIPVNEEGTIQFTKEDAIYDHGKHQGPHGLYSLVGTKLTAARSGAEMVLQQIFKNDRPQRNADQTLMTRQRGVYAYHWKPAASDVSWKTALADIIQEESVVHLDDLVLRRTTLGDNPKRALELAPVLCRLFDWDDNRSQNEIDRLKLHFSSMQELINT